jgi:magnesium chelatase family protein
VLDALRQPLEDGVVHIGRARLGVAYPSRCMLVAAMNPCPCGFHGTGDARCICNPGQVTRYLGRVSGPLLDRIDLHVEVAALTEDQLASGHANESSAVVRARVLEARARQLARFGHTATGYDGQPGVWANAHMSARDVRRFCEPDAAGLDALRDATRRCGLSARGFHRILRVARTIADLDGAGRIVRAHVAEAVQYRSLDRVRTPYARGAARVG